MSERKRLHPVSIAITIFKRLKDALFPFIFLFFLRWNDSEGGAFESYLIIGIISSIFLFFIISSWISWLRFMYSVEADELQITSGVIVNKKRYVKFERIQSIDLSEGILQRIFGLVKIKIETAGSSNDAAEVVLTAVTKAEAEKIQTLLADVKDTKKKNSPLMDASLVEKEASSWDTYSLTFRQLFLMAATSGGVGVVFSGAIALFTQVDDFIPYKRVFKEFEQIVQTGVLFVAILTILALLIAYLLATAGILLKYAYFTVTKTDDELIISRGLLERRKLTIPLGKIQGLRITENLIRQPMGYCSVTVEYAGGSVMDKESINILLFPMIKKQEVYELMERFTPGYELENSVHSLPKRAFRHFIFKEWLRLIPIIIGCLIFLRPWGYASIALLGIGVIWAYLCYQDSSWKVKDNQLQLGFRFLSKHTVIFHKKRIQSLAVEDSWFQKRRDLASISVAIVSGAGVGGGKVANIEKDDAVTIRRWFSDEST